MRRFLVGAATCAALCVSSVTALATCDPGEVVIKFSHVTNTDKHPKGIAASLLEKRVNEEMNGVACMQVFPNSSLYDDNKVLEALLNNDVQLAAPSLSKFEKFTKKYRIFDLPFMFEDIEAVDRFQNSETGQQLKEAMKRRGLLGLAFWHNGMKQMSANRPLIMPADAKGLKFRVQASDVLVVANKGHRRTGKHLVQYLWEEVLRGSRRDHRDQPRSHRLLGRHLRRVVGRVGPGGA